MTNDTALTTKPKRNLVLLPIRSRRTFARIDVNIIHQHGLRKNSGCIRISRPTAANRDVEQYKKWMIINPFCPLRQVGGSAGRVKMIIDKEANRVRFPFDREDMKVVGKALIVGECVGRADTVCA